MPPPGARVAERAPGLGRGARVCARGSPGRRPTLRVPQASRRCPSQPGPLGLPRSICSQAHLWSLSPFPPVNGPWNDFHFSSPPHLPRLDVLPSRGPTAAFFHPLLSPERLGETSSSVPSLHTRFPLGREPSPAPGCARIFTSPVVQLSFPSGFGVKGWALFPSLVWICLSTGQNSFPPT